MKKIIPKNATLVPKTAKRVFKGVIFDVYQWPLKMYDGSIGIFEMLKRPDTVVVIAIKDNKIVVLKQSQPNLKGPFLDFPGGRAEPGETPIESAKRELLEETGMSFKNWKLINVEQKLQKIEQFVYTFLATEFENQIGTNHDAGEKIEQTLMSFKEILEKSQGQVRLETEMLEKHGSLKGLMDAPEFEGQEVDI